MSSINRPGAAVGRYDGTVAICDAASGRRVSSLTFDAVAHSTATRSAVRPSAALTPVPGSAPTPATAPANKAARP